jgi:hypothetical protein
MPCRLCQSTNQRSFPSEVAVHPPSNPETLSMPHLLIYPHLLVCLDCGFTEFSIPDESLHQLPSDRGTGKNIPDE